MDQKQVHALLTTANALNIPARATDDSDGVVFRDKFDYLTVWGETLRDYLMAGDDAGAAEFRDATMRVETDETMEPLPEEDETEPVEKAEYVQGIDDLTAPPAGTAPRKRQMEYPPPEAKMSPPPSPFPSMPEPEVNAPVIRNSVYWYPSEGDWRVFQKWVGSYLTAQNYPSLKNLAEMGWARDPHLVASELLAAMLGSPEIEHGLQKIIEDLTKLCDDHHGTNSVFVKPGPGDDPGPPLITDQKAGPPLVMKNLRTEFANMLEAELGRG